MVMMMIVIIMIMMTVIHSFIHFIILCPIVNVDIEDTTKMVKEGENG